VKTTLILDGELIARAQALTGIKGKSAVVNAGLKLLISRESARRLAVLGGSEPDLRAPRRRRRP
jgi:Arc/MetJ family transcription regulator